MRRNGWPEGFIRDYSGFGGCWRFCLLLKGVYKRGDLPAVPTTAVPSYGDVLLEVLDLPVISDTQGDHQPWLAAYADPWGGVRVQEGARILGSLTAPATMGRTETDFYSGTAYRFDRANTLTVKLSFGVLASVTEDELLERAVNVLAVWNGADAWELIQFAGAELIADTTWQLSGLLRGRRGTAHAMRDPVPAGSRVGLPLIAASQTQKEVTHNEALARLDTLAHLVLLDRDLTAPPAASDGDIYLVASSATGAWAGQEGRIACFADGFWSFYEPMTGLLAFIADEGTLAVYTSAGWKNYGALLSEVATLSQSASGAESRVCTVEEEVALWGTGTATTMVLPDRSIVLGVSSRTTETVTGVWQYHVGITGEPEKFGGYLGIAEGSTNAGVIGPQAFYADAPLLITANGDTGSFTGGKVRLAAHYFLPVVPGS